LSKSSAPCYQQTYHRLCLDLARTVRYQRYFKLPTHTRPLILLLLSDVLLICPAIHRPAIYHHIHSDASSSLHVDLQTYDESQDSSVGTCAILRHFASRVTEDFILVPCDFIPPPSLPLSLLLNKFRVDAISDGAIATTCWFETHKPAKDTFPEEWGPHIPPTSIVWDEPSGTLLYVDTPDDQERNADEIVLRMSLLSQSVPLHSASFNPLTAPILLL